MSVVRYRWSALALAAVLIAGCSEPASVEIPPPSARATTPAIGAAAAISPAADKSAPVEKSGIAAATPTRAVPQPTTPSAAASPAVNAEDAKSPLAEYTPPFPDRVDLFVPPKRQGGARIASGENEDAVELLGFVRVDEPKVVLSINGFITPVAEGANQFGIEVISIQPPTVVLQRGRQRWQATLEN